MQYTDKPSSGFFFKGQLLHWLALIVLLAIAFPLVDYQHLTERRFLGVTARGWFIIALLVPIIHQFYVWIVWRSELCFAAISGTFGQQGFAVYRAVFMVFLFARPLAILALAISDHDSLAIPLLPRIIMPTILAIPAAYTLYSVARYFGPTRAVGADHFDPSYRELPLVREGVFRFTSNAMYALAFLMLHAIAIAAASRAALVTSLFSHAYIWVHYYCTERPDMQQIYGAK